MEKNMEKVYIITAPVESIKVSGSMTKNTDMESYNMSMEINIKGIGRMGKGLDKEFINIQMAIFMKVNGLLI